MRWFSFLCFFLSPLVALAESQASVSAELLTDHDVYLSDVANTTFVEARFFGIEVGSNASASTRNIAFVLDRSGSMAGSRIESLRKAVSVAIRALSKDDIISVVFFGSEIETVVEAKRRDQLQDLDAQLAQVDPAGGSALYDALNQGAALIRRNLTPNSINRIILVTDGPATKGPRETTDFTRLADLFAHEGITLSTIGIGPDFDEDQLAQMARIGSGQFRFADKPESLFELVTGEVESLQRLVARDVTLKFDFNADCEKLESYSWTPATMQGQSVTYSVPYVFSGRDLHVLIQTKTRPRHFGYKLVTLHVTWKDPTDGATHEVTKTSEVNFTADESVVQRSIIPAVARAIADGYVRQGLQDAILQIDKGDLRRALRPLRETREEMYQLNFRLDDAVIDGKIKQLEVYLDQLRNRGISLIDRKILRSGIMNQFGVPTAEDGSTP